MLVVVLVLALAVGTTGCVQFNRGFYDINEGISTIVLEPVAGLYLLIVPKPLQEGVSNFLTNLRYGDVVVNQLLQGKTHLAFLDLQRWVVNSTLGLGGLLDVATGMGLERHDEDFGQTLAVWGVPQGHYLVLPLIGPTTPRDAAGTAISIATNPTTWAALPVIDTPVTILSYANRAIEARAGIRAVKEEAADPYTFVREAYLQRRCYLIWDGNPPARPVEGLDELDLEALEEGAAPRDGAEGLPGLEDLDDLAPPGSADELPGLEDYEGGGDEAAPDAPDALPGLDDL